MSFEERSAWVQLASLVVVLGIYFVVAWQLLALGVTALPAYVPFFMAATVLLVVVMVVGHIAAALGGGSDERDERDRLVELVAESRSGWIVGAGVLTGITMMILSVPNVWTAHLLLLSLYLSEVLKLVLQVAAYRRGL